MYLKPLFALFLMVFSPSGWASFEIEMDQLILRDLILEPLLTEEGSSASTDGAAQYSVLSEALQAGTKIKIISGGKEIPMENAQNMNSIFVDAPLENWTLNSSLEIQKIEDLSLNKDLSLKEYEGLSAMAAQRLGMKNLKDFICIECEEKPFPSFDAFEDLEQLEATLLAPVMTRCEVPDEEEAGIVKCQQLFRLKVRFKTEKYEGLRKNGVEPYFVLKGQSEGA